MHSCGNTARKGGSWPDFWADTRRLLHLPPPGLLVLAARTALRLPYAGPEQVLAVGTRPPRVLPVVRRHRHHSVAVLAKQPVLEGGPPVDFPARGGGGPVEVYLRPRFGPPRMLSGISDLIPLIIAI
jgi:hypothetical protein